MKSDEHKVIEAEIEGVTHEISFDIEESVEEYIYGGDADGHRGQHRREVSYDYCRIWVNDQPLKVFTNNSFKSAVYSAIEQWIEDNPKELK